MSLKVFSPLKTIPADRVGNVMEYWVDVQRQEQPDVKRVFDALTTRIPREKPQTVRALVDLAHQVAQELMPQSERFSTLGPAREHYTTMIALTALAGHAYSSDKLSTVKSFPKFIAAGGDEKDGRDKARHLVNQALISYLTQFDETFESGEMAAILKLGLDAVDANGASLAIGKAYDAVKGRAVGLLPGTSLAPVEEGTVPYFKRPTDLSAKEARAYDLVVRMGDSYEDASTKAHDPAHANYDLATLGQHPEWKDALARVDDTKAMVHGLADPGVTRDLTADRVGAYLGVQLFRDPTAVPKLAFDEGPAWKNKPFEAGPRGTSAQYLDREAALLASVDKGTTSGVSRDALVARFDALIDRLGSTDRETLSKLYANFAVRQLAYNVSFGEGPGESPDYDTHLKFAQSASPDALKAAVKRRVLLVETAFAQKSMNAALADRLMFDPSLVPTSPAVPFAGGALMNVSTAEGPARLAAHPDGKTFFIPPALTPAFEFPNAERWGLPTREASRDAQGTSLQAFAHGSLSAA